MFDELFLILTGICSAAGCYRTYSTKASFNMDVEQELYNEVNKKYSERDSVCSEAVATASRKMNDIHARENAKINSDLNSNSAFVQASAASKAAQEKISSLERSINNFKSNSTKVAVGSGDSAVAVSLEDSSAKAKLEADLAEAKAMKRTNDDIINTLKAEARAKVVGERSESYYDLKRELDQAKEELTILNNEKADFKEQLRKDPSFMKRVEKEAVLAHYSKTEIIGNACLQSALPAYALYLIWKKAGDSLNYLRMCEEI